MRSITVFRAFALVGAFVTASTMVIAWGDGATKGPPPQWERHAVGAILLCGIVLVSLWAMGTAGTRRAMIARAIALVASAGAVALALIMRQDALANDFGTLLSGHGWTWFLAGTGLCLGASFGSMGIKAEATAAPSRKTPARKRARGR